MMTKAFDDVVRKVTGGLAGDVIRLGDRVTTIYEGERHRGIPERDPSRG